MVKSYRHKKFMAKRKKPVKEVKKLNIDEFLTEVKERNKYKQSLEYLNTFYNDKETWKFNKNIQTFLFTYIFFKKLYGKENFNIFLVYLESVNEAVKKSLIDKCKKYIQDYNEGNLKAFNDDIIINNKEKYQQILDRFQKRCVLVVENS